MVKSRHTRPTSAPPSYSPPERDDGVLCFTSRDHLLAWHNKVHHEQPCALREVNPQSLGDVNYNLAVLAAEPHGGTLLMLTPPGSRGLDWLKEVREEHARDAISGPHKVRMEGEPAVLIGVQPNAAPTAWDRLEPDGWPVPGAVEARLDDRRVAKLMRAGPFAPPVGRSERDHRDQTLLESSAHRWFRGKVVPTIAGLVALGDQPERFLPGCAVAVRRPGWSDQLHSGALPWLAERVAREHGLWGQIPSEVARTLVVLALAERAWAGPDAATPITLTVEDRRVRLAVPTAAANAIEREDRASANPRLRHLLVQCGDLPALPHGAIMDNDAVLAVLDGKYPGGRCDFESAVTWLTMPLVPEARVVPRVVAPLVRPAAVAVPVPPQQVVAPPEVAEVQAPRAASPVRELPPRPTPPTSAVPASAPLPARPRRPVPPPIFHPRPPLAALTSPASPTPALAQPPPAPAPLTLAEPVPAIAPPEPTPSPPVLPSHPTGAMSLDERKAQLRDLFRASDRPLGKSEIAAHFGVHRDTLRHAMNALVAEGWLEPTDTNLRSPVLRYRRLGS